MYIALGKSFLSVYSSLLQWLAGTNSPLKLPLPLRVLDPHLIVVPWAHPSLHHKQYLDLLSQFCTAHGSVPILYNGQPLFLQKLPLLLGDLQPI